jgi:hypothetical protein
MRFSISPWRRGKLKKEINMTDTNKLITEAEMKISKVLAKLEADTGTVLERIEVRDTEVTTVGDRRPQWLRRVFIEMKPLPGTRWE